MTEVGRPPTFVSRVALFSAPLALCTVAACGSRSPPPKSETEPLSDAPTAASTTPEPAASPELMAGIKAFDAGHYGDARSSFEAAVKRAPSNYEALYNLGLACEKLGDRAAAEAAYRSALARNHDLDAASADLSALYIDEGRSDEAAAVARAGLSRHPKSPALRENLGVALASTEDKDAATGELESAVELAPNDAMMRITLAHWQNVWHVPQAAASLDGALALVKDDLPLLATIGYEYRLAGQFSSCLQTFDRAIALKDAGELRTERALCKHGLKDDKGALADLRAAVQVEPSYAPAHFYLGGRLAVSKQYKDAAAEYAKYLELEPTGSMAKAASLRKKAAEEAAHGRTR